MYRGRQVASSRNMGSPVIDKSDEALEDALSNVYHTIDFSGGANPIPPYPTYCGRPWRSSNRDTSFCQKCQARMVKLDLDTKVLAGGRR